MDLEGPNKQKRKKDSDRLSERVQEVVLPGLRPVDAANLVQFSMAVADPSGMIPGRGRCG